MSGRRDDDSIFHPYIFDENVRNLFVVQLSQETLSHHLGDRLICDCTVNTIKYHSVDEIVVEAASFAWEAQPQSPLPRGGF